jgi:hypothetical protein
MFPGITDELYWNMAVAETVVALGQQRGLRISYYRPPFRTIVDGNDPGTNWSVGRRHAAEGGYAVEIHFDAWGPDGIGSGLIPPLHRPFGRLDESLAEAFGGYPMAFRGGLGGPRRGIALLEVGKLEGSLERSLRDPATRHAAAHRHPDRGGPGARSGPQHRWASAPHPTAWWGRQRSSREGSSSQFCGRVNRSVSRASRLPGSAV